MWEIIWIFYLNLKIFKKKWIDCAYGNIHLCWVVVMSPSWNFLARAEPSYKVSEPSRAELGHFNFRAETELEFFFMYSFFSSVFWVFFASTNFWTRKSVILRKKVPITSKNAREIRKKIWAMLKTLQIELWLKPAQALAKVKILRRGHP